MANLKTQVLIIGGGVTGTGVARDLSLRGVDCILAEKRDINAGASGANHGLLHSGARYVSKDLTAARECQEENKLLKRLAPQCIEDTGGLFVAVEGDDERYVAEFPQLCNLCGIPCQEVDPEEAREIEPTLSKKIIGAFSVNDASIDPFRLSLENISQATDIGCRLLLHTEVLGFALGQGKILSIQLQNNLTGQKIVVEADQVINATGAWVEKICSKAGVSINILYSKGSLLITDTRLTDKVVNRLRPSADADILVPGRTVSILGTTSIRLNNLDDIRPTVEEIDFIIDTAVEMIPSLSTTRYIRAYAGIRPLVGSKSKSDDRSVSRGFVLMDHAEDGVENLTTIACGKLTTFRKMAEKTADLICRKLGVSQSCLTKTQPLPSTSASKWTQPGLSPRIWIKNQDLTDLLLCECEMVPQTALNSIIDEIRDQNAVAGLRAIGLRSRIGKGTCQGTFCGVRISAHMYDRKNFSCDQGLIDLKSFLNGRWKGIRPVLWGTSFIQEELQEALHCGLFGLEL